MLTVPRHKKPRARYFRNLSYRIFATLAVIVLSWISFHSTELDIPENIAVEGFYEIKQENILALEIEPMNDFEIAVVDEFGNVTDDENASNGNDVPDDFQFIYDKDGKIITQELREAGIDLGFISSKPFIELGTPINTSPDQTSEIENKIAAGEIEATAESKPLDEIIPPSESIPPANRRNLLIYDKYKIRVPIIYTNFSDLFNKRENGTYDFRSPTDTDSPDSPVQKKLEEGIVHLAYTPQPGEIGNSYIVGHSSNYSWVDSPYNRVFEPIRQRSQVGETFVILDRYGRELKFEVFEVKKIAAEDVSIAYKNYTDRRVVTLQTSILGYRNGKVEATHRWITRGELVVE